MCKPNHFPFRTQKKDEPEGTCEDSVDPKREGTGSSVFAVADGATQSFYSRLWAEQLTHYFTAEPDQAIRDWEEWLRKPREAWLEALKERVAKNGDDVYLVNNYYERRPAAATFAGLRLHLHEKNEDGLIAWDGLVLGDSCLFHLRSGGKVDSYAKKKSADFTFITESAQSYPKTPSHLPQMIHSSLTRQAGPDQPLAAEKGDAFLLATDAFSKWMFAREEAGKPVWGVVAQLNSEPEAKELVFAAREDDTHPLEDDDVAFVVVRLGSPHDAFKDQKYKLKPSKRTAPAEEERDYRQPAASISSLSAQPASAASPELRRPVGKEPGSFVYGLLLKGLACLVMLLSLSLLGNLLLYKRTQRLQRQTEALQRNEVRVEDFRVLQDRAASLDRMVARLSRAVDHLSNDLTRLEYDLRGALVTGEKGDVAAGSKDGLKTDSTKTKSGVAPTP